MGTIQFNTVLFQMKKELENVRKNKYSIILEIDWLCQFKNSSRKASISRRGFRMHFPNPLLFGG